MSTTTYTSTNARRCASCGQRYGRCLATCPDRPGTDLMFGTVDLADGTKYIYLANGRSDVARPSAPVPLDTWFEAPQSHVKRRYDGPGIPLGGIALIVVGTALMGLGFVMNSEVSWMIYNWLHR